MRVPSLSLAQGASALCVAPVDAGLAHTARAVGSDAAVAGSLAPGCCEAPWRAAHVRRPVEVGLAELQPMSDRPLTLAPPAPC